MKLSSKGRYAVRIMSELGRCQGEYVSVAQLSEKQGITVKYLEKIISMLNRAGLIESSRGSMGGYKLVKSPKEYSIAEILRVTDDLPKLAPCIANGEHCPRVNECDSIGCWEKLSALITNYLSTVTLEDVITKKY